MYCQNCGAKNNDAARFCMACGSPLTMENPETNPNIVKSDSTSSNQTYANAVPMERPKTKPPKKKKKAGKSIAVCLAVVLVLVIGSVAYMATHEPPWAEPLTESPKSQPTTSPTTNPTTVPTTNSLPTREEYMAMCKTVDYKDIERNPSAYEGVDVKFTGQVIQVSEEDEGTTYRISVNKDEYGSYNDPVLVYYEREAGETRVLEDDIVTFYGECRGVYTYESVMGGQITVPAVYALIIEIEE